MQTALKWLERRRTWFPCGRNWWKTLTLRNRHDFLITFIWDALNVNANQMTQLLNSTKRCLNPEFPQEQLKNYHTRKIFLFLHGPTIWKDMLKNAWNYIANWQTKRLNNSTKYQLLALTTIIFKEALKSVGELSKLCSQNCSEMLILGTYWKTRYSMVSEQTCTIDHKMDQSMWQTTISFDLLHSSYKWIQTILSCGKHCKTMQIGSVSRIRFCRRSWRLKINIRSSFVHVWKSNFCTNQLDVQKANLSVSQLYGTWSNFVGCWFADGRSTCAWLVGFVYGSAENDSRSTQTKPSLLLETW